MKKKNLAWKLRGLMACAVLAHSIKLCRQNCVITCVRAGQISPALEEVFLILGKH